MGGCRADVGHHCLGFTGRWAVAGVLVGLHHSGVGRVLVLGPGGERGPDALVGTDGLHPLHHGAEAPGHVPNVEYRPGQRGFRAGLIRHVHEPGRTGAVGPLLWRFQPGLGVSGVLGGGRADSLRSFLLAVPAAKERSDPGLHALPGGGLPGEQPVVAGNRVCHPLGQCLSPDLTLDCRRRDNHCPAFLRPGERAVILGLAAVDGSGPPAALAPGHRGQSKEGFACAWERRPRAVSRIAGCGHTPAICPDRIWIGGVRDDGNLHRVVAGYAFPASLHR